MTRSIAFLPVAEIEAADAIDWYEEREPGLGVAFRVAVETRIESVLENHSLFRSFTAQVFGGPF